MSEKEETKSDMKMVSISTLTSAAINYDLAPTARISIVIIKWVTKLLLWMIFSTILALTFLHISKKSSIYKIELKIDQFKLSKAEIQNIHLFYERKDKFISKKDQHDTLLNNNNLTEGKNQTIKKISDYCANVGRLRGLHEGAIFEVYFPGRRYNKAYENRYNFCIREVIIESFGEADFESNDFINKMKWEFWFPASSKKPVKTP